MLIETCRPMMFSYNFIFYSAENWWIVLSERSPPNVRMADRAIPPENM